MDQNTNPFFVLTQNIKELSSLKKDIQVVSGQVCLLGEFQSQLSSLFTQLGTKSFDILNEFKQQVDSTADHLSTKMTEAVVKQNAVNQKFALLEESLHRKSETMSSFINRVDMMKQLIENLENNQTNINDTIRDLEKKTVKLESILDQTKSVKILYKALPNKLDYKSSEDLCLSFLKNRSNQENSDKELYKEPEKEPDKNASVTEVLKEVQEELVDFKGTGMSVMEMSHRSNTYLSIHQTAIDDLRDILKIPDNYKVLLMQGGGTGMFASVCLNLMGQTGTADYIVTGTWSAKAAKEAEHYGKVNLVLPESDKHTTIPSPNTWKLNKNASYVYYCDNETVDGVEFQFVPETNGVPLVCDMSSNFLSKPIDVTKFGVIFAGAQKNIGPSGITVVIIRDDLLGHQNKDTPSIMNFGIAAKNNSIYNTPPTFIIYVMGKVFTWIKKKGGVQAMYDYSLQKSKLIYDAINESNGFYYCPVEKTCQSRMNIPFRIGSANGNTSLESEFLKAAEADGMIQLKGHRSVGGIRASLYNAITTREAEMLANFMKNFYNNNQK